MDYFMEYLVPKKKDRKDKIIISGIIATGVVVTLLMFVLMFLLASAAMTNESLSSIRQMIFSIGLVLVAFAWYGAYLLINTRSIEYEYILTNNEIDIDKVLSKKGRKHLVSFDIKSASVMARIDDNENNAVYKNPPEGVKVLNYSAMSKTGFTYFVDCEVDEKRTIVLFQPTSKMVETLWKFNPKAVKRYND